MMQTVISGTGVYVPTDTISNDEIVASFNAFVHTYNHTHAAEIESGQRVALQESSAEFISKASGIQNRFVMNKSGILDVNRMRPMIEKRGEEALSIQAEFAVKAAEQAMANAGKSPGDIDAVIFACSAIQRAYPAMGIEVQNALGIEGFAMDMNVACSSATFALQVANNFIQSGGARCILVVSPELTTGHVNFLDRDSHFIFSDACAAVVLESEATCQATSAFTIVSGELKTSFSNNIRNDFGFLNHCEVAPPGESGEESVLFRQNGRKVFKEVVPMTVNTILSHLDKAGVSRQQLKRLWLHQANSNMDRLIGQKVFDRDPSPQELPIILDEYANTAAAGSIIAFHHHRDDLQSEDYGVICSFGAGYSIGSLIVQKV